jgi:phosphoserine phosphatase RsbU/P
MSALSVSDMGMLGSFLDSVNTGLYITDSERRIIAWNRKAEEITGYRADQVLGKGCPERLIAHVDPHGRDLCATPYCPLKKALASGEPSDMPILGTVYRNDGSRAMVVLEVGPLMDCDGKITGCVSTFTDDTEHVLDLEAAMRIQHRLLPTKLPNYPEIRFDVAYFPHSHVGGDFYDLRPLGPDKCGVLIADVQGHGVASALYTMWLKGVEDNSCACAEDPSEFLCAMNHDLHEFILDGSFTTAFYGVIDMRNLTLTYSNAGHPGPLHVRKGRNTVTALESHGMPLGIVGDENYGTAVETLDPGDVILCYTDGVTEVFGADHEMLGEDGLAELLLEDVMAGQDDLLGALYYQVASICGDVYLSDDALFLAIEATASNAIDSAR